MSTHDNEIKRSYAAAEAKIEKAVKAMQDNDPDWQDLAKDCIPEMKAFEDAAQAALTDMLAKTDGGRLVAARPRSERTDLHFGLLLVAALCVIGVIAGLILTNM